MPESEFPYPEACWISSPEQEHDEINARFVFVHDLVLTAQEPVSVAITADSRYWLAINGAPVASGPARGYRDLAFFDTVDVSEFLRPGSNRIEITVTHWGVDTFQYQRGVSGLLAAFYSGDKVLLLSGEGWRVRRAVEWCQHVPRISIQQGFEEHFDARVAAAVPKTAWRTAMVRAEASRTLHPRATENLVRTPRIFQRTVLIERLALAPSRGWSLPVRRHFSPFPRSANQHGMAGALASLFCNDSPTRLRLHIIGPEVRVWIDGVELDMIVDQDLLIGERDLDPGEHWVGIALCTPCDHAADLAWSWHGDGVWSCPLPGGGRDDVWVSSGPLWSRVSDTNCFMRRDGSGDEAYLPPYGSVFSAEEPFLRERVASMARCRDLPGFLEAAGTNVRILGEDDFSEVDAYLALRTDEPLEDAPVASFGVLPGPLAFSETPCRVILDLGGMSVGYFEMELECPEGTIVDGFFFEHLDAASGVRIQYLHQDGGLVYRNSFRYTAHEGVNVFHSRQRRGGRYVLLVFRGPARLLKARVIEETYPPHAQGSFHCSDERLNRIYEISRRTLLLCMEDTFTDCPTYEQALWVGDARNEALFACEAFGAYDLARHCLRLAAHSLQESPFIACQCPSGWDVIIPSFSFLWGISIWDVFWQTGDREFLGEMFPPLRDSVAMALRRCTDRGLFRAPAWNFFDWTSIDQDRQTVLHNSMLLSGALDAAMKAARELGREDDWQDFSRSRETLVVAISQLWDPAKGAWRDSVHDDGSLSDGISQHTSFLALLHDLAEEAQREAAIRNCLAPPAAMTRVGSPHAMFFLLDALRKEGCGDGALALLRDFWGRMLDAGADTFWEMIHPPGSQFPTRSHCHGWSSSPVYLLPHLLFGIECMEPGWRRVVLHPAAYGLEHASAQIHTPHGLLTVAWEKAPDGSLDVRFDAPPAISVVVQSSINSP